MLNEVKIAVIGAGIAGCTLARELRKMGIEVAVFEKSRGAGGRMSTRRNTATVPRASEALQLVYDHGAPAFESMSGPFRAEADAWTRRGWAARWTEFGYRVGTPYMSALPRYLLEDAKIETRFSAKVDRLERMDSSEWFVHSDKDRYGPFSDVVITVPAPQALELIGDHSASLRAVLQPVIYESCWVLLGSWKKCAASSSGIESSRQNWGVTFSRVSEESTKPGRRLESGIRSFAFQALPSWSAAHLEDPSERIVELLVPEAERVIDAAAMDRVHVEAHRWRYARVIVNAGKAFGSDLDARLHACGDAFMGDGVENAWMSAMSLSKVRWCLG